ncbi:uncharacterized protein LOC142350748 [Convolutriloba macropyga]|uniref:uncharacterized protein LOC142350748 n=1 Tax=Convolutriloba macropyga TaxID=536237 RepID=UPI003F527C1D
MKIIIFRIRDYLAYEEEIPDYQIIVALSCRCFMFIGSTINPIIYGFVGQNFRSNLKETMNRLKQKSSNNSTNFARKSPPNGFMVNVKDSKQRSTRTGSAKRVHRLSTTSEPYMSKRCSSSTIASSMNVSVKRVSTQI